MDSIELSLFVSRMEAVCHEMGVVLRRTAFSPNIKDRLDFSCALFDARGELCAQAAHIPVHLGSMAFAMQSVVDYFDWHEDDVLILNDPFLGGTHLPDVTVIAPLFDQQGSLLAFVVNRAHHANIGSESPGSMPNSSCLQEEGLVIEPQKLLNAGQINLPLAEKLSDLQNKGHDFQIPAGEIGGDIAAQLSALHSGKRGLGKLLERLGSDQFTEALCFLNDYAEQIARSALNKIPHGNYDFVDYMDDDGLGKQQKKIQLKLSVGEKGILADFTGTDSQAAGNINCPLSVTAASVFYVFRCLMPDQTPACAGIFRHLQISAPEGCLVNARFPAAVVAGNVETSSRIVDVVLGALQQALPLEIPAASQGTMNNIAMGSYSGIKCWDYYETLAGGTGAGAKFAGVSAVHSHMTNTLNTPIESLEMHYPLRIRRYAIRHGSGGKGRHVGGDGLIREYEFLEATHVSILSERRRNDCWGLSGGEAGQAGQNLLDGYPLPGKCSFTASPGQHLTIHTPGGGAWGEVIS
jgi:N-methylhydantoinase B